MGAPIKTEVGQMYNFWRVIEANVINPNTTAKMYIGRPVFSKCLCTKCNKTERYFRNYELKNASQQCNSCALIERNTQNREVQIGKIYGYLEVTGDGGYNIVSGGKRRHFSYCKCLLCGKENILKMDNQLQSGSTVSCGCLCSKGEQKIIDILNTYNIPYQHDVTFEPLTKFANKALRFDFIIYDNENNIQRFVEFDGIQHNGNWNGGVWSHLEDYEERHKRDLLKNDFCLQNNYILVRIPYSRLNYLCLDDIMSNRYVIRGGEDSDKTIQK